MNVFPYKEWEAISAREAGYSVADYNAIVNWANNAPNLTGLAVAVDGRMLFEWGNSRTNSRINSVRKAVTGILCGILERRGLIDLDWTMGDLGIVDGGTAGASNPDTPLNSLEQTATIEHCLWSSSAIYHRAAYETSTMDATRPARISPENPYRLPGEVYWYNNWDFNIVQNIIHSIVSGTAFDAEIPESDIGTGIVSEANGYFDLFAELGQIIGLEDWRRDDANYLSRPSDGRTMYPAWLVYASPRDMCRIGHLALNRGNWNGKQLYSPRYHDRMVTPSASKATGVGWGYSWNTGLRADGSSSADTSASYIYRSGSGGQRIYVWPHNRTVIATQNDRRITGSGTGISGLGSLLSIITGGGASDDPGDED